MKNDLCGLFILRIKARKQRSSMKILINVDKDMVIGVFGKWNSMVSVYPYDTINRNRIYDGT